MTDNKPKADISFEVGYKDEKTRFDMRMISVSEETQISQKLSDIADADDDKAAKEYRICLDALADYSESEKDGANLREKFSEMTLKNERVVRAAFQMYRNALAPDVSFF